MPTTATARIEDAEIGEFMDSMAKALRAKSLDALMAHYAPDVVVFDIRPPLQVKGVDAYRENFEAWFNSVKGQIDYRMHELRIAAADGVALCHSLSHVRSVRTTGEKADYWVRVTSGLRKIDGRWLIAHEHISQPIDLQTLRSSSDLQP